MDDNLIFLTVILIRRLLTSVRLLVSEYALAS